MPWNTDFLAKIRKKNICSTLHYIWGSQQRCLYHTSTSKWCTAFFTEGDDEVFELPSVCDLQESCSQGSHWLPLHHMQKIAWATATRKKRSLKSLIPLIFPPGYNSLGDECCLPQCLQLAQSCAWRSCSRLCSGVSEFQLLKSAIPTCALRVLLSYPMLCILLWHKKARR